MARCVSVFPSRTPQHAQCVFDARSQLRNLLILMIEAIGQSLVEAIDRRLDRFAAGSRGASASFVVT